MNILCIETSTSCCSAAICIDGVAVASKENLAGANHASELPVFVEQLLAIAAKQSWHIDAVALSEGPGSYTGLRIGASLAKGLCYSLDVPLIPVDTLQVLCATMTAQTLVSENCLLCPMLDARRMEVYTAMYQPTTLKKETSTLAKVVDQTTFAPALAEQQIYFFGNGADKCKQVILSPNAYFVDNIVPHAQYMGQLAEDIALERALDAKQMAYYEPFYLKEFVPAPSHIKGLK